VDSYVIRIPIRLAIAATFLIAASHSAAAQLPIPSLSIAGGVSHYDLSGTSGSTPIGEVRVDVPIFVVIAEGSAAVLRPTVAGNSHTYVIPEAQLQWQLFPTVVKPYLGVGGGWFKSVTGGSGGRDNGTLSASAGVRVSIPATPIALRGEVRVRTIGSPHDHATEFTLGASW
jgi:hypothetical protein